MSGIALHPGRVIVSFRHKGLRDLFETGDSARVRADLQSQLLARLLARLDALDRANPLAELDQPGFDLHALRGKPKRHSIHVNGPWCLIFEWDAGNARRVDLETYH